MLVWRPLKSRLSDMTHNPLAHIRIVMVQTFHPGNIGSAARAMKTMGLSDLVLVSPRDYPSEQATAMAAGATDVLDNARAYITITCAKPICIWIFLATQNTQF